MSDHAAGAHGETLEASLVPLHSWPTGQQATGEFQHAAEVRGHVVVTRVKDELLRHFTDRLDKHRDYE